jgi:hypothetical protein
LQRLKEKRGVANGNEGEGNESKNNGQVAEEKDI